jgi:hypothetical protein
VVAVAGVPFVAVEVAGVEVRGEVQAGANIAIERLWCCARRSEVMLARVGYA